MVNQKKPPICGGIDALQIMANTYTQIHIHIQVVFAVRKRIGLIQKEWRMSCTNK